MEHTLTAVTGDLVTWVSTEPFVHRAEGFVIGVYEEHVAVEVHQEDHAWTRRVRHTAIDMVRRRAEDGQWTVVWNRE